MTTPVYQQPYPYGFERDSFLNSLQHQEIVSAINSNGRNTTSEVNAVDRHLSEGVLHLSGEHCAATSKIVDTIGAQSLGVRDSVERNGLSVSNGITLARQDLANSARDIQVAVERTSQIGSGTTERVGSSVLSTVERVAGEAKLVGAIGDAATRQATNDLARDIINQTNRGTSDIMGYLSENRYTSAVGDAATRQATNDLARDIIAQSNRNSSEIASAIAENRFSATVNDAATRQANNDLARDIIMQSTSGTNLVGVAVERNGNDTRAIVNSNMYETRTLINQRSADAIMETMRAKESLASQGSTQYSSTLLETHKLVDALSAQSSNHFAANMLEQTRNYERVASQSSQQYASLLMEQQKVKEHMTMQMADSKYEALKNKEALAAQLAAAACESKYDALKNTQALSSQLAECCCEIKMKVGDVSVKLDDTVRTLDTNRLRDALNTANNDVNLYKILEHTRPAYGPGYGYGPGYYGHHGGHHDGHHGHGCHGGR
jgi:hypothetical protein